MSYSSAPPPADWYPDPSGGAYLRWWNGIAWTEQTKPAPASAPALPAYPGVPAAAAPVQPYGTAPYGALESGAVQPYGASQPGSVRPYAAAPTYGAAQHGAAAYGTVQPYATASSSAYGIPPIGAWRSPADTRPLVRGMGDAIRVVFQKYATFEGRATRSEYWYWTLFTLLTALVLFIPYLGAVVWFLWALVILIPGLAVTVRRLRDGGYHWALIFLSLVPFGSIAVLVLLCQPSKRP